MSSITCWLFEEDPVTQRVCGLPTLWYGLLPRILHLSFTLLLQSYLAKTLISLRYSSHSTFSSLLTKVQMDTLYELVAHYLCFLNS